MTPEILYEMFGFYDSGRCIEVKGGHQAICQHPYPFTAGVYPTDEIPAPRFGNREYVELKAIANGTKPSGIGDGKIPNVVGYAGKCPVCGKVFYRGR